MTSALMCKFVNGKGGRKQGLFGWVFEVGAGAEVTTDTEYRHATFLSRQPPPRDTT
jgi:hypothetical protein